MSKRLWARQDKSGFFLMEVIVLIIVFISFSMIVLGWYSHFVEMKINIMKRGQAVFIASNILEAIRVNKRMQKISFQDGFRVSINMQRNKWYKTSALCNFAEVAVRVWFSDILDPVSLSTGLFLEGHS